LGAVQNIYLSVVGWVQVCKVFLSPMGQTYCYKKFALGIPLCQANFVNCCPQLGVLCVNCRDWKADDSMVLDGHKIALNLID
jgi:hypothetical protein